MIENGLEMSRDNNSTYNIYKYAKNRTISNFLARLEIYTKKDKCQILRISIRFYIDMQITD